MLNYHPKHMENPGKEDDSAMVLVATPSSDDDLLEKEKRHIQVYNRSQDELAWGQRMMLARVSA